MSEAAELFIGLSLGVTDKADVVFTLGGGVFVDLLPADGVLVTPAAKRGLTFRTGGFSLAGRRKHAKCVKLIPD